MAKIHDTWMDNVNCDDNGKGAILYIELDNCTSISMSLDPLAEDPLFSEVMLSRQRHSAQPQTDGDRIHWSNGASITINDIVTMIQA